MDEGTVGCRRRCGLRCAWSKSNIVRYDLFRSHGVLSQVVLLGYFAALQYAHLLGSAPANARELGSDDVDFAGREVLAAALAILGQCAAPPGTQGTRVLLGYFAALQYAHLLGSAPANARENTR